MHIQLKTFLFYFWWNYPHRHLSWCDTIHVFKIHVLPIVSNYEYLSPQGPKSNPSILWVFITTTTSPKSTSCFLIKGQLVHLTVMLSYQTLWYCTSHFYPVSLLTFVVAILTNNLSSLNLPCNHLNKNTNKPMYYL